MRRIVNGLLVRDGKVLLALRSPQRLAYAGKWSFPGGHAEENETLVDALTRELREEIGVAPTEFELLQEIADPNCSRSDPAAYYLYVVSDWVGGEPQLIGDEHTELQWCTPRDASKLERLALVEYRTVFDRLIDG